MLPSSSRFLTAAQLTLYTTKTASRPPVFPIKVKPPNSGHPKQQTNHLVTIFSQSVTIFLKLCPNNGHLSIMEKIFKICRCLLFRDFTVLVYNKSLQYQKLLASVCSVLSRNERGLLFLRPGVLTIRPQLYGNIANTVKPLNSGHLQVFKNLSVIERCGLLGGNLKKIVTFRTK